MYRIRLKHSVQKELDALHGEIWERIRDAIASLGADPRPRGSIHLVAADAYRLRVGDYRIIYEIDDEGQVVTVTRVSHRREAYRRN